MREKEFTILIVEDNEDALENLHLSLQGKYNTLLACNYKKAVEKLEAEKIDLLVSDIMLPDKTGLDIVKYINEKNLDISTILVSGYTNEERVTEALRIGVNDVLKKPYAEEELHHTINLALREKSLREENERLREKLELENKFLKKQISVEPNDKYKIIGNSEGLKAILRRADKIAAFSVHTLITGETGTGKELLARYIHRAGPRKNGPFVAINCAALSPTLFESELFGYIKGAFTNANESRAGLVEAAHGGTLFLDEITEIPQSLQAKLLRVIESQKVRRIGSKEWVDVDVVFLSSSNRTLDDIKNSKYLRQDLFHRLASTVITLPPLREREEDIPLLAEYYAEKFCRQFEIKKDSSIISKDLMKLFMENSWPGNIRQFANIIKTICLFGDEINSREITELINSGYPLNGHDKNFRFSSFNMDELDEAKKWMVMKVLKDYNGNKKKTAEHLGLSYQGLLNMLKHFELEK